MALSDPIGLFNTTAEITQISKWLIVFRSDLWKCGTKLILTQDLVFWSSCGVYGLGIVDLSYDCRKAFRFRDVVNKQT
jgi:hypothetical protein